MLKSELIDDIDYVKNLAETGRNAPLLGGRIGIWWGILLSITLFSHWCILTGVVHLHEMYFGVLWIVFAIVGTIGTIILSRKLGNKPGVSSVNNRVAAALWMGNTILLFSFGTVAGISAALGINDFDIMNLMSPLAFGLYGLTAYVLAQISGVKLHLFVALIGIGFMALTIFLLHSPNLFLAAILGVICTIIIPDVIFIRNEPKPIE